MPITPGPTRPPVTIEMVRDAPAVRELQQVFRQVWGPHTAQDTDIYVANAHKGQYLSIARDETGRAIGGSYAFLTDGGRGLHSHETAVIPGLISTGVGRQIKQHQRAWAAERGIDHITWTFDPTVRRNAWFNLARLGATVSEYYVNLYGIIGDGINGQEETDRLEVSWSVAGPWPSGPTAPAAHHVLVPTPADIESMRATDPAVATGWRMKLRAELGERLQQGARVVGITADGEFVLEDVS